MWSSCHNLTDQTHDQPIRMGHKPNGPMNKQDNFSCPIGKLQRTYIDGTQVVQLTKPKDGPIGFFITKGNAKYGNGGLK